MGSMFQWVGEWSGWVALVTLSIMEIVLGIDNVIFISLIVARLPEPQARVARIVGLSLAFALRVVFLGTLTFLIRLTTPLLFVMGQGVSARDLVLGVGGLFLVWKAVAELHHDLEPNDPDQPAPVARQLAGAIVQIALIDLVFSIDSTVTAIGMAQDLSIMVLAVFISMLAMAAAAGSVAGFIRRHPTTKVLALAFLVLIGVSLIAEAGGVHIPRGYLYFAMGFGALVEVLNILGRNRRTPPRAGSH